MLFRSIYTVNIAVVLTGSKFRKHGLYAAFSLMAMFTVYIYIVVHYSSFVPCSCGGILEKMSWDAHLVFNLVFVLLAALALLLQNELTFHEKSCQRKFYPIKLMSFFLFCSVSLVTVLPLASPAK